MSVRTLEKTIGADELTEWVAHRNIEGGLPYERLELYLAQIAMYIYLAFSDGKQKVKLSDFMICREKRRQTKNEKRIELLKLKAIAKWQERQQTRAVFF